MTADLPDLRAGIYRHFKGPLYQVIGYGHDANADGTPEGIWACTDLSVGRSAMATYTQPLAERMVVVYFGLELDDAHPGPRFAMRSVDDFFAWLHDDATVCPQVNHWMARYEFSYCACDRSQTSLRDLGIHPDDHVRPRFAYVSADYRPGGSNV